MLLPFRLWHRFLPMAELPNGIIYLLLPIPEWEIGCWLWNMPARPYRWSLAITSTSGLWSGWNIPAGSMKRQPKATDITLSATPICAWDFVCVPAAAVFLAFPFIASLSFSKLSITYEYL